MPAPQIRFWRDVDGQLKPLIHRGSGITPTRVAMGDLCCCKENPRLPGYATQARDCCTNEVYNGLFLDLGNPPLWVWGKYIFVPGDNKCVFFDIEDIGNAVLLKDAQGEDYLANTGAFDNYDGCNECRCANNLIKCCDFYPDPNAEAYEYSGITLNSGIFTCRYGGTYFGIDFWWKSDAFDPPEGLYTGRTAGGTNDPFGNLVPEHVQGDCPPGTTYPDILITVRYYSDATCSTAFLHPLTSEEATEQYYMTVGPLGAGTTGGVGSGLGPNQTIFDPLLVEYGCDYSLFENDPSAVLGIGGFLKVYRCCPEDPGI